MNRKYRITVQGRAYEVEVGDIRISPVTVLVDGVEYQVEVPNTMAASPSSPVASAAKSTPRPASPARPAALSASDSQDVVRAPMPGRIVNVNVSPGDRVQREQALLVLESMKMENTIAAPRDGIVRSVNVAADDSVQHGQTLVELE